MAEGTTLPSGAATKDYPKVLGVTPQASSAELKRRYRQLVREHHPDQGGDPETFKEVSEAYEVLSDPRKRAAWEEARRRPTAQRPEQKWRSGDIADLFERITFERLNRTGREPELVGTIEVDALDALEGSTKQVRLPNGTRQVQLPARLQDRTRLLLDGELLVEVRVRPHPVYRVDGDDVHVDVPVTFPEVALGGEVDVPTPTGPVRVRLKPGTRSDTTLRLAGRGADLPGGRGDVHAHLRIQVPTRVEGEAREHLEAYQQHSTNEAAQARRRLQERATRPGR